MRFKLFPATLPETFRKLVLAVLLRISSECFDNPSGRFSAVDATVCELQFDAAKSAIRMNPNQRMVPATRKTLLVPFYEIRVAYGNRKSPLVTPYSRNKPNTRHTIPTTKHGQRQYAGHGDQPYFLRTLRYSPGIAQLLARTRGGLNTTYDLKPARLNFNVKWKKSVEAAPINASPTTTAGSCRTI